MGLIQIARPWDVQPQEFVEVDWTNPLAEKACAIVLPYQGGARVFAKRGFVESLTFANGTGISYAPSYDAIGIGSTAESTNVHRLHSVANATNTVWELPSAVATWGVQLVRYGNNVNGNAPIFGNTSPTMSPYAAWSIVDSLGVGDVQFECSAGGGYRTLKIPGGLDNNIVRTFVGRYNGSELAGFRSGAKYTSTTACSGALTYVNNADRGPAIANFWNYVNNGRSFKGRVFLAVLWDLALSDAEIREWDLRPWQLFKPRRAPIFYSSAASTLPTLSNARVTGITATGATPLVDYNYA